MIHTQAAWDPLVRADVYVLPPLYDGERRAAYLESLKGTCIHENTGVVVDIDVRYALFQVYLRVLRRYHPEWGVGELFEYEIPRDKRDLASYPRYPTEDQRAQWVERPEYFDVAARREQQILQFVIDLLEARVERLHLALADKNRAFGEFLVDLYYLMCWKPEYRTRWLNCTFDNPNAVYDSPEELRHPSPFGKTRWKWREGGGLYLDPESHAPDVPAPRRIVLSAADAERKTRWVVHACLAHAPADAVLIGVTRDELQCAPAVVEPIGESFQGWLTDYINDRVFISHSVSLSLAL
jgi:hypothetical protein